MQISKFTPTRPFFTPHEEIELKICLESHQPVRVNLCVTIQHMQCEAARVEQEVVLPGGERWITLSLTLTNSQPHGYGLKAELLDSAHKILDCKYSAVDTLERWIDFPRYGFLTDFTAQRADLETALDALAEYHINGIQFYDWQYRHDELLSPYEDFVDPLGRSLSMKTVRSLIEGAHRHGMAAMPYLAVYAASLEFCSTHPDWQLFDAQGKALDFEGFLGLMDPTPGSPWIDHLLRECGLALSGMPFDGLHVDQYGEPKIAYNNHGEMVDLPLAFKEFIARLKETFPKQAVVFNAVGNWPIDSLASSRQDFIYIEIWPPAVTFRDLRQIVTEARLKSGGKPVVIALYLPANQPVNIRLANAVIMASGGSRIELGENTRLLSDPYFPKHQAISPELAQAMQANQDFLVRYSELLGPSANQIELPGLQLPPGVLAIVRRSTSSWCVNLINFTGMDSPRWDQPQPAPVPLQEVNITIPLPEMPEAIWAASPDAASPELLALPFTYQEGRVQLNLPELHYWSILVIQLKHEVAIK